MSWDQRGVVLTLMWDARWRDEQVFNTQTRQFETVGRGQLLISQRELSANAGVGRRVVRTTLAMLEADPGDTAFLTQEPTQGKTLITIENYSKYQGDDIDADPATDPAPTQQPTQRRPGLYYTKKGKKGKKGKNEHPCQQEPLFTSHPGTEDDPAPKAKKKPKKPAKRAPWQRLLDVYYQDREELDGKGPQLDWGTRDKAIAQALLKGPPTWTVEELAPLIRKYNRMDDDYVRAAGYPWAMFPKKINKLRIGGGAKSASPAGRAPFKGAPDRYTGPPPRKS
jgi:hypothetical protein